MFALSLPRLALAEKPDDDTFYDLFSRCFDYATSGTALSSDGLKPLKTKIASKVAPDAEVVYHKPKGAFTFLRENWGFFYINWVIRDVVYFPRQ